MNFFFFFNFLRWVEFISFLFVIIPRNRPPRHFGDGCSCGFHTCPEKYPPRRLFFWTGKQISLEADKIYLSLAPEFSFTCGQSRSHRGDLTDLIWKVFSVILSFNSFPPFWTSSGQFDDGQQTAVADDVTERRACPSQMDVGDSLSSPGDTRARNCCLATATVHQPPLYLHTRPRLSQLYK